MCDYDDICTPTDVKNWFKCCIAVRFAREGLVKVVKDVIADLQKDILQKVIKTYNLSAGTVCQVCSTASLGVIPCRTRGVCDPPNRICLYHHNVTVRPCPNRMCDNFRQLINQEHRFKQPSWRNTDATGWAANPWEVAKCFLPQDGYMDVHSGETTDFIGIMSILINCKCFQNVFQDDLSKVNNVCTKARDVWRDLKHNASFKVSDESLVETFDTLLALLKSITFVQCDEDFSKAQSKISKLQNDTLAYSPDDVASAKEELKQIQAERDKYNKDKGEFQRDLKKAYIESHRVISLSSIIPNFDETIDKFYASLKLACNSHQRQSSDIETYTDIFYRNAKKNKNIYIQGEAGTGKSLFCVQLALVWCKDQATASNHDDMKKCYSTKTGAYPFIDYGVIQKFDFLFLIVLRLANGRECSIENMIRAQILNMSGLDNYTDGFVGRILDEEKCLIILDGLDEWLHPDNQTTLCPRDRQYIPHRKLCINSTFITTTRPCKNAVQVKCSEMDANILLKGVQNIDAMADKVIKCLNEKFDQSHTLAEFKQCTIGKIMHIIQEFPNVLMHLICLWYVEHTLSESICAIYSSIIDAMLERAKKTLLIEESTSHITCSIMLPQCFKITKHCDENKNFLLCMSELAYNTLIESTTVFGESVVAKYVSSAAEKQLALQTGILIQSKSRTSLTKPRCTYSFLHNTFQTFLAAFFIAMATKEREQHQLFEYIEEHGKAMGLSEIFTFVCGMNQKQSTELSTRIAETMKKDVIQIEQLTFNYDHCNAYQRKIIDGYSESYKNGLTDTKLVFYHASFDSNTMSSSDWIYLKDLLDINSGNLLTCIAQNNVPIEMIQTEIARNKKLSTVVLSNIDSSDPETIDLSCHNELERLYIYSLEGLSVDIGTNLVECVLFHLSNELEEHILTTLSQASTHLQILRLYKCKNTKLLLSLVSSSPHLQLMHLECTDLGDSDIMLTNSIKDVIWSNVSMHARSFKLLLDVLCKIPVAVRCKLQSCTVTPEDKFDALKKHVLESNKFTVRKNDVDDFYFESTSSVFTMSSIVDN